MDVEQARTRLQELLSELDGSVAVLVQEGPANDTAELAHYDQHPADAASTIVEADRESALIEVAQAQREQVVAALERIDAGTFGRCVDCGTELPDERLDARPEAARCITCQTAAEGAR